MNIAICDDESNFLNQEYNCIQMIMRREYPDIEFTVEKYTDGKGLVRNCINMDLVFLDIELNNEDGFNIAKQLIQIKKDIKIIFVTSHENLVFESFVFRPVGFIRKRVFDQEIEMIITQVISGFIEDNKIIVVGENKNTYTILVNRIRYIDTIGHNIMIKMKTETITVRDKISRIEKSLLKSDFIKINRGSAVNLQFVTKFENGELTMEDGIIFKVSRSKLKECESTYRQYVGMR